MHPAEHLRHSFDSGLLKGKRILLCVTGSIAAVETVKLARRLIRAGADVTAAMTDSATSIIHPEALRFATGKEPILSLDGTVQHVVLCGADEDGVDLVLVAPCTANIISKMACGICDDAVSTILVTALGAGKPIVIAPAMHGEMWSNPIIAKNLEYLSSLGITVVQPEEGENKAKMADEESIFYAAARETLESSLAGRNVTIIGGSTAEPIDSVRVLTNRSTGKTAIELAKYAYARGADVSLFLREGEFSHPPFINVGRFSTVEDLLNIIRGKSYDIVLVPAAISDYKPETVTEGKIKSDREVMKLTLVRTKKLLENINAKTLVGFKLEVGIDKDELIARAREKLKSENLSAIVANRLEDVEDEFSKAILIDSSGREVELAGTREDIARGIIDHLTGG